MFRVHVRVFGIYNIDKILNLWRPYFASVVSNRDHETFLLPRELRSQVIASRIAKPVDTQLSRCSRSSQRILALNFIEFKGLLRSSSLFIRKTTRWVLLGSDHRLPPAYPNCKSFTVKGCEGKAILQ